MKSILIHLLALTAPLLAGEIQASRIPASAAWQLHADIDAMRASESGKAVLARIEADHGPKLRAFQRMFALHPLDDLHGVTLYGDGRPDHAVALIDGNFDRPHLEDIVQAADDYSSSTHGGLTVHSWNDHGKVQHAAFASDHLLVFSRQEILLESALDALASSAAAAADPFFQEDGARPLVAASARVTEIEMPGHEARILRLAESLRLAANEHEGRFSLRIGIDANNPAAAGHLQRILHGIVSFAQVSDEKLDGLDLHADFSTAADPSRFTATLSLPVGEWISLMEKAAAEKAAAKVE